MKILNIGWLYCENCDDDGMVVKKLKKVAASYCIKTIQHPLFGPDPVKVFAIKCDIYWQYIF